MQGVMAVPQFCALRRYGEPQEVLTQEIAGVPLLARVIATAMRAGVTELLLFWPGNVSGRIWDSCRRCPAIRGLNVQTICLIPFDPRRSSNWAAVSALLEDEFIWIPWNFVTHRGALAAIEASAIVPLEWDKPVRLSKTLVGRMLPPAFDWSPHVDGVSIRSRRDIRKAEEFLVRHSGKATDGIYSTFNRRLCRPAVRFLSHTPVTPNEVTLLGLVCAIISAVMYSRGFYWNYVAGALLFFISGLFDEMDGMLARLKFRESPFGTWFEGTVDNVTYVLLFCGITVGLDRQLGTRELAWGMALIVGCVLSALAVAIQKRSVTAPDRPHEYAGRMNHLLETDSNLISRVARQIHIFIKKGVAIHYILIFTVLGALPILLRMAAIAANLTWTLVSYFTWKFKLKRRVGSIESYGRQVRETI
jgi:phosphatidylglycerophosphate synthase